MLVTLINNSMPENFELPDEDNEMLRSLSKRLDSELEVRELRQAQQRGPLPSNIKTLDEIMSKTNQSETRTLSPELSDTLAEVQKIHDELFIMMKARPPGAERDERMSVIAAIGLAIDENVGNFIKGIGEEKNLINRLDRYRTRLLEIRGNLPT